TRYDDVVLVNRDNELFSSARGSALIIEQDEQSLAQQRLMMLNMDPPMHTRYRLLVNKGFTPRMVGQLEERARAYVNAMIDDVSVLLQAEIDGDSLTELEFDLFFLLLAVAGNETTRNLIAHGQLALMDHPDQRARLIADPSLVPHAVDEMLRWGTPVMHFRRTAQRDTEIRGQRIAEGDKVVIFYISANRDEDMFSDPYRFDIGRNPNEHVAFGGGGPHFCLGANLARLEIRVMFEELL